jgi:hypothetical protein
MRECGRRGRAETWAGGSNQSWNFQFSIAN